VYMLTSSFNNFAGTWYRKGWWPDFLIRYRKVPVVRWNALEHTASTFSCSRENRPIKMGQGGVLVIIRLRKKPKTAERVEHPHKSSTPSTPHPSIFRFAYIRNQLLLQNQIFVFLSLFSGQGVLNWLAELSAFTGDHSLKFCWALSPVSGTKS
jgi:hypothetical protein